MCALCSERIRKAVDTMGDVMFNVFEGEVNEWAHLWSEEQSGYMIQKWLAEHELFAEYKPCMISIQTV